MFKLKITIIFLVFIAVSCFVYSISLKQNYVVPILMYHSVFPEATEKDMLVVTPRTFDRQMAFLKKNKYNVLALEELAQLIKEKKKIPAKAVVITLDDGFKDNYTYAFPILKKYGLPATIFIITNEVGRRDHLSWEEIKEMQGSGIISFGSHCLGPKPLINISSREEVKKEIFDSKRLMEQKLGKEVSSFAYPEGLFNPEIRQMVIEAGYRVAVATKPGKDYPDDDIFALKRLRISEKAANMFVFAVETSGFYTYMQESKRKK